MMDSAHRQKLQQNRTFIIQNVANPESVNDLLFEKNVFTESMRQEVEAESTKHAKVRKILDYVPKRGPHAYELFHETLVQSSNELVADTVMPELRGTCAQTGGGDRGFAIPQPDMDLPQVWPDEQAMSELIQVRPCNVRSELVRTMWNNPNVYSMRKRIRGRCLIISNKNFHGPIEKDKDGINRTVLSDRHGTDKDVEDLTKLFEQMHFKVIVEHNCTKQKMAQVLFNESSNQEHEVAECFICIICSHGTREGIYGTDGNVLPLSQVTEYFDNAHCTKLQGKPKVFFIQACQGEDQDRPRNEVVGQDLANVLNKSCKIKHGNERDGTKPFDDTDAAREYTAQTSPTKSDMLVACATHPGYVSIRNTNFGSWFLQAVVYIFQKYSCTESIQDLLTLVNRLVAMGRTSLDMPGSRDAMQASRFESSLTKKFLFFPGVVADTEMENS